MDKYLLQILKEVSTIIIPGIGALTIVNQVTGEIMFLSFMKFDDEKLAIHIAEKEGWSLNDAKNLVAKYVRDINAKLAIGDTYDMYQFGSFSKNKEGEIEFTSWEGTKAVAKDESRSEKTTTEEIKSLIIEETAIEIEDTEDSNEGFSFELDADNISEVAKSEIGSISNEPISIDLENIEFNLENESIKESPETLKNEDTDISLTSENKKEEKAAEKIIESSDKPSKSVTPKVKSKKVEKTVTEEITEVVEKTKEIPEIEKIIEVTSKAAPVAPVVLSVEDQLNDDLDVEPINDIKPIVKKPILEKTISDKKSKKRRVPVYLWIILGLLVGGGIFTAINYDNIKQHIPFLADNSSLKSEREKVEENSSSDTDNNSNSDSENNLDSQEINSNTNEAQIEEATPSPKNEIAATTSASSSEFTVNKSLPYQVIVGSFSEKSNAERQVKTLQKDGFAPEIIGQYDGLYFVSLGSFNSMSEVNAKASKISTVGSYWVFKK